MKYLWGKGKAADVLQLLQQGSLYSSPLWPDPGL